MFIRDIAYAAPEPVHYAFRIPAYTMINLRHYDWASVSARRHQQARHCPMVS
ncbi:hypothetical protein J2802_004891 [Paraburkholderia caribensis]|nr:hypothetical protein [Paraburkholderia caribensis]